MIFFKKKKPSNFEPTLDIYKNTRCLMVAPHPDDEVIGCGGTMVKYAENFDCICFGSSGIELKIQNLDAKSRSNLRIKEFNEVMDRLKIKNHWIFETYGVPPLTDKIEEHFKDYCKVLKTKTYDYIFLPHPNDAHGEHNFITNDIFKRILKHNGFNENCRIVFYEIWSTIAEPNYYEDISDVIYIKTELINIYKSQNILNIDYDERAKGLNRYRGFAGGKKYKYAEAFKIVSINEYIK